MKKLLLFFIPLFLFSVDIDIVIPCIRKDTTILEASIDFAKKYVNGCRRIIVVSPEKLTENAEWFDEALFPFSKESVGSCLVRPSSQMNRNYRGWFFQQLLKFYAPFVIPDIAENLLVLDADTLFLQPINFLDDKGRTIFYVTPNNPGLDSYIRHMHRLHPSLTRTHNINPIVNFMLFQKDKLEKLFSLVEEEHNKPFWQAFCEAVSRADFNYGASEFTLYFFFLLKYFPTEYLICSPKWDNHATGLYEIPYYVKHGYAFISLHHYNRTGKKAS